MVFDFRFDFFTKCGKLKNDVNFVLERYCIVLVFQMIPSPFVFKTHLLGQCLEQLMQILKIKFLVTGNVTVILVISTLNLFNIIYPFLFDLR